MNWRKRKWRIISGFYCGSAKGNPGAKYCKWVIRQVFTIVSKCIATRYAKFSRALLKFKRWQSVTQRRNDFQHSLCCSLDDLQDVALEGFLSTCETPYSWILPSLTCSDLFLFKTIRKWILLSPFYIPVSEQPHLRGTGRWFFITFYRATLSERRNWNVRPDLFFQDAPSQPSEIPLNSITGYLLL